MRVDLRPITRLAARAWTAVPERPLALAALGLPRPHPSRRAPRPYWSWWTSPAVCS